MKKRNYTLVTWLASILVLAAILAGAGCETTSPSEMTVTVTPNFATLMPGESVTLTASGWNTYSWSLSKPDYGFLASFVGETVTYQALKGNTPPQSTTDISNYNYVQGGHTYIETTTVIYYDEGTYWRVVTTKSYTPVSANAPHIDDVVTTGVEAKEERLRQIVTVKAVGPSYSSNNTNASSIAVGQVTILQGE